VSRMPKVVNVHPQTVSQVDPDPVPAPLTRRFYGRRPAHRATSVTVHPEVWRRALAAADGDALRIEVFGPADVRVHNTRGW